ncbi:MAG: biotin synthase BioB [Candidatus Cloacimonadota bacterium]|nr:MAG: biotin synthase BioB [Candidatus Cloacimonadota bacterium]PIE80668.1 MAG: biotin synthase BioB [Candidatus Delongbacteria bacterium]
MLHKSIKSIYNKCLEGEAITKNEALELSKLKGEDILDLVSLANKVRKFHFADETHVCTILNTKSGKCSENCRFCAQSAHYNTGVKEYPLLDIDSILEAAKTTYESGVKHFGLVTSGQGYRGESKEFDKILEIIDTIYKHYNLNVCASVGILDEKNAKRLADRNIKHYNINLQTAPSKYKTLISTTHEIEEKYNTIKYLKKYGVDVCAGGIFGVGESIEDRIEMAFKLKDLNIDVIPINVLIPIPGTPMEGIKEISVSEIALSFCITRLINPTKIIKFAAGRETKMKDFQALLMLSGANGFLTGGYLTTRGRDVSEDMKFVEELKGFTTN